MAPARRSTARGSSATPVSGTTPAKRATRGSSVLEHDEAIPRRTTRGASHQPNFGNADVNNPRLPEVQISQSYAYGSSKTPVLPTQLNARKRMNLREMAETIDVGVDQAEQHLQEHIKETRANLQNDARSDRALRRASREPSHEGSVASGDGTQSKSQRVAAWASSVDNPQLDHIEEESQRPDDEDEQEEDDSALRITPDEASNRGTDPSSFPSGIFDHSYNYERGLRKPNVTVRRPQKPFIRKASDFIQERTLRTQQGLGRAASSVSRWSKRLFQSVGSAIGDLPNSPVIPIITTLVITLLFMGVVRMLFCFAYSNYICDPLSTSAVSQTLQSYCGTCARNPYSAPLNVTVGAGDDFTKLTSAINSLNDQLRVMETRINKKVNSQYALVDKDLDALKKQHSELSNHVANLKVNGQHGTTSGEVASPVISKVNYFAPNNGAIIDPRLTSPTMQKPLGFFQRVLIRVFLSARYVTRPPITALSPWHDVGDCWCASAEPSASFEDTQVDTLRLGVKVTEMIYPTELVIENYPSGGSLLPGSAPFAIELWADFEHLDSQEWEALGIRQMQGPAGSPIGPSYAMIGRVEYDASAEAPHVQPFSLDVNQGSNLAYSARNFVVRVPENYGAEYTCLYRVRLHGVSVAEHSSS